MDARQPRKRTAPQPGLRALEACGDGFWELDLEHGVAWFSEWLYRKLEWPTETKRTTLSDLQSLLSPAAWTELLVRLRAHLEHGSPLDLEFQVSVPPAGARWWRLQGTAQRTGAGPPVYLAGSMRDVSADRGPTGSVSELVCVHAAFEALPVAAALLDAHATLLEANRQWHALPAVITAQAIARLRAANSHTAIEFSLDRVPGSDAGPRPLLVRAIAFQHNGERHLAVTLEDRRSD